MNLWGDTDIQPIAIFRHAWPTSLLQYLLVYFMLTCLVQVSMRLLGPSESCPFEQTTVTIILLPDASQARVGGPLAFSAALGTSERLLVLSQ